MKLILLACFLAVSSLQATEFVLGNAFQAALGDAQVELDNESIEAFSARLLNQAVDVQILGSLNAQKKVLKYECDQHGDHFDCHGEEDNHFNKNVMNGLGLKNLLDLHNVALKKFEATLLQRNQNLSSIIFLKAWKTEGTNDHATTSVDVWTRFDYNQNNSIRTVYVQCHDHGSGAIACHYKQSAVNEPTF